MAEFRIEGRKVEHVECTYDNNLLASALLRFRAEHPGFRIEAINDEEVVTWCEGCECPIFDGDEYSVDDDGVALCEVCLKEEPADG